MSFRCGLTDRLAEFCETNGWQFENLVTKPEPVDMADLEAKVDGFGIPDKFERREYQMKTVQQCLSQERALVLSPTSSGKSMIIYMLLRLLQQKTLLLVPSTGLVEQMYSDFESYGFDVSRYCAKLYSKSLDKDFDKPVIISTWQSVQKHTDTDFFNNFGVLVVDEAHEAAAKCLTGIVESATEVRHKFRFYGYARRHETARFVSPRTFRADCEIHFHTRNDRLQFRRRNGYQDVATRL